MQISLYKQEISQHLSSVAPTKQLLSRAEAAEYLGVSTALLAMDMVHQRHKFPYVKIGRRVLYKLAELDRWLAAHTVNTPKS